jgi:hypothetical protein
MCGNNSDANGKQSRNTCSEIFSDSKLNDTKKHIASPEMPFPVTGAMMLEAGNGSEGSQA